MFASSKAQAPQEYFRLLLLTVVGQALGAAGYQLDERPTQWAGGLFRFATRFETGLYGVVEYQLLHYAEGAAVALPRQLDPQRPAERRAERSPAVHAADAQRAGGRGLRRADLAVRRSLVDVSEHDRTRQCAGGSGASGGRVRAAVFVRRFDAWDLTPKSPLHCRRGDLKTVQRVLCPLSVASLTVERGRQTEFAGVGSNRAIRLRTIDRREARQA